MLDIVYQKKVIINMEDNSKYTAIKREKNSFPLNIILKKNLIVGDVLDYGCGHGADVEYLKEKGINVQGYDPNFFPESPVGKFDTIICFYVLNVLPLEEEKKIIANVSSLLKPNGKAYFAIRRDIVKEGKRFHVKHKKYTYQRKVYLDQKSVFKNKNCEIYEMEHFTVKNKSNYELNPFLSGNDYRIPFSETMNFVAFHSKYPQAEQHIIISSKTRYSKMTDFSDEMREELSFFIEFCENFIKKEHQIDTLLIKESTENNRLIKSNQWHLQIMGG